MRRRSNSRSDRKASQRTTLVSRTAFRVLAGVSEAELTLWEHEEFIVPVDSPSATGEQLYDSSALRRVRVIRTLAEELEVNLPGIGVILRLLDQMER